MKAKTIAGFALGPIGAAALSLVSLPILAWIFAPSMIGQLSMLQVAVRLSTLLCSLGLDQAYVREYHEAADKPRLLLNATTPGLMVFAAGCAIVAYIPERFSDLLYGVDDIALTWLTLLCLLLAYVVRFLSLVLRMQDRGLAFSMSQLLAKLLLLVIVLIYAVEFTRRDFKMLLMAQTLAWAACFVVFTWNTRKEWLPALRSRYDRTEVNKLLAFGWPLVLGGVASWALVAMDRIFLRAMSSYGELAIYSVAGSVASGVTILGGIFNVIWAPLAYKWHAEKADPTVINRIAKVMLLAAWLVVCLAGGAAPILRKLLPASYAEVPELLPLCVVAPLFYTISEVTGIGVEIQRKTILSMLASVASVAVNVVLCFVLVPRFGAAGAASATACAFWVFFMIRTVASARVWLTRFSWMQQAAAIGLLCVALLTTVTSGPWGRGTTIFWWVLASVLLLTNRRLASSLIDTSLQKFRAW